MLLIMLGTHAIGKSTYCADLPKRFPVQSLLGDSGKLVTQAGIEKITWRTASAKEKALHLDPYVADDTLLTVAEGCRFFGGTIIREIRELYDLYGGGVIFIVVSTTAKCMLACIQKRCRKSGKEFRKEYWEGVADYYATRKYQNSVAMHAPHIPKVDLEFNGDYSFWKCEVDPIIEKVLGEQNEWYR